MLDYQQLTNLILESLLNNITNPSVNEKVRAHLHIGNINEDTVNVVIDDEFVRGLLTNQYKGILEETVREKLQSDYKVKIFKSNVDLPNETTVDPLEETRSYKRDELVSSGLDRTLTFDNYIVSSSNELAASMAKGAMQSLGTQWNPLFIHGGSGFGKTHLINAFGNEVVAKSNGTKAIKYFDGNSFKNTLFEMFSKGPTETNAFKESLWRYDVIIFDDIQFIGQAADTTISVFFEIFNEFIRRKKHVVLTSDISPQEMKKIQMFHDRLITRFSQGIAAKIDVPDQELKEKIVSTFWDNVISKIDDGSILGKDAVTFIAHNFEDIRSIQGAINGIFLSLISKKVESDVITKDMVKDAITHLIPHRTNNKKISFDLISKVVSSEYGIERKSLKGASRVGNLQKARNTFAFLAKQLMDTTFAEIGKYLNRTHSTVMSSIKKSETDQKTNKEYKELVERLTSALI